MSALLHFTMVTATPIREVEMSRAAMAVKVVIRARDAEAHVVTCTYATLPVAILAALYAWSQYSYHLCVRLGRDHPACHDLRSRAVEV